MSFQIHALSPVQFEPLFTLSDRELAKVRATRMIVDAKPGYPCRVSLADADVGEGSRLSESIPAMLQDPGIAYLHLHNAKPGCFAARVTRA